MDFAIRIWNIKIKFIDEKNYFEKVKESIQNFKKC